MINKKQLSILAELRKDSRQKLSNIARKLGMPITTFHDNYKKIQHIIKSHNTLIDFEKLGYSFRMNFIFRMKNKNILNDFLLNHKNIDAIQLINNKNTLLVWGIFQKTSQAYEFKEILEEKGIRNIRLSHVIEEISKEKMLA